MQGFEISGRAMQLGWGQENKDEKLLSAEGSRSKLIQEQQHAQVRFERVKSLRMRQRKRRPRQNTQNVIHRKCQ